MSENNKIADSRFLRLLIVVAGILLGQVVLYGPSLMGTKILLPLDLLTEPGTYIPLTPETMSIVPQNRMLLDLVTQSEPARQFAFSEIHQGRLPLWAPYQYGGVPFVWPKYSLFLFLASLAKSPVILAWMQLFAALVAGLGMYFFCRRVLPVSFWPAAVCAWCYPLTAFFILWQGFLTALPVYWLPWLLLSIDQAVRGSTRAVIGLSVITGLVLTSGQIDIAAQVLLGSGIYALWCLWNAHPGEWFCRKARTAVAMLVLGWGLGFLLAAPHMLPMLEYVQTGSRMMHRFAGAEERPPVGLTALPQLALPDIYGTYEKGSIFIPPVFEANLLESVSAAYAGVLATLLVAPLAWCSRRHRTSNGFWAVFAFFGLSWCLNVPGLVQLLRLPGLNMLSHDRLVFLTAFAILSLTAIGLENLLSGTVQRRWWFWLPGALLAGLCGWCLYRSRHLPEPVATQLEQIILHVKQYPAIRNVGDVRQIQAWFVRHYVVMAEFCGLGLAGWWLLWLQKARRFGLFPILAFLLVADLLWFDHGRNPQCDPSLYYPRIPALDSVAKSASGRIIGSDCLPSSLALMQGLTDIRGFDAVDPIRMVNLLKTTALPDDSVSPSMIQSLIPRSSFSPAGAVQLAPVLDMLNVRYVIFRGIPPPSVRPAFQGNDYWVMINSNALPRVFIPRSVQVATNAVEELKMLASAQFNPAAVAYVESPVELPADCRGAVQIENEVPTRLTLSARMETPGLVVLADNWDRGWRAYWNGQPVPVLRANYAVRGVVVPAGSGTLEFIYEPASVRLGFGLAGLAVIVLAGWLLAGRIRKLKTNTPPASGP